MYDHGRDNLASDRSARRRRLLATAASVAAHAVVLGLLAVQGVPQSSPPPPEPMTVTLIEPTPPIPPAEALNPAPSAAPAAAQAATAAAAAAPVARPKIKPTPPSPEVEPLPVSKTAAVVPTPGLSDAELAGAATAGSGQGGGGDGSGAGGGACDMIRRLQDALRSDPDIQAAVTQAHSGSGGRAMLIWNGDWVQSPGQEGKGLAGVRQAIIVEVAFAPKACRAQAVRGRVLISMSDRPGAPRIVLGAGDWRWSDLLSARGVAR